MEKQFVTFFGIENCKESAEKARHFIEGTCRILIYFKNDNGKDGTISLGFWKIMKKKDGKRWIISTATDIYDPYPSDKKIFVNDYDKSKVPRILIGGDYAFKDNFTEQILGLWDNWKNGRAVVDMSGSTVDMEFNETIKGPNPFDDEDDSTSEKWKDMELEMPNKDKKEAEEKPKKEKIDWSKVEI